MDLQQAGQFFAAFWETVHTRHHRLLALEDADPVTDHPQHNPILFPFLEDLDIQRFTARVIPRPQLLITPGALSSFKAGKLSSARSGVPASPMMSKSKLIRDGWTCVTLSSLFLRLINRRLKPFWTGLVHRDRLMRPQRWPTVLLRLPRKSSQVTKVFPTPLTLPFPNRGEGTVEIISEPFRGIMSSYRTGLFPHALFGCGPSHNSNFPPFSKSLW